MIIKTLPFHTIVNSTHWNRWCASSTNYSAHVNIFVPAQYVIHSPTPMYNFFVHVKCYIYHIRLINIESYRHTLCNFGCSTHHTYKPKFYNGMIFVCTCFCKKFDWYHHAFKKAREVVISSVESMGSSMGTLYVLVVESYYHLISLLHRQQCTVYVCMYVCIWPSGVSDEIGQRKLSLTIISVVQGGRSWRMRDM